MNRALCERLDSILQEIAICEARYGRTAGSVALLAASKTQALQRILDVMDCGQRAFGENYAQELEAKRQGIGERQMEWHFIGPIQSNKTRTIANQADWVHSIDRLKIARRLSEQRPPDLPALQVCLEINVDAESSKAGIPIDALPPLAEQVAALPRLQLRGLMCIPEPSDDEAIQRSAFRRVRLALEDLQRRGFDLDTLSMGMSGDFPMAIAEGATIVRIGTALFGPRQ